MVFIWIVYAINKHSLSKRVDNYQLLRRNAITAVVLVTTFGLAWVIGFLATTGLPDAVQLGGLIIFTILVSFHGTFLFILHTVRSKEIREECKKLFYTITRQKRTSQKQVHSHVGSTSQQGTHYRSSISSGTTAPTRLSYRTSATLSIASSGSGTIRPQLPSLTDVPEEIELGEQFLPQHPRVERQGSLIIANMGTDEADDGVGSYHGSTPSLWSAKEEGDVEAAHTIFINYGVDRPGVERQSSVIIPSMGGEDEDEPVDESGSYCGSTPSVWSAKEEGDTEATHTIFIKFRVP